MPLYVSPGEYVEEVSSGARPIEMAGTSRAAFLGHVPNPIGRPSEPVEVQSLGALIKRVGKTEGPATHLINALAGFFQNGGVTAVVLPVAGREVTQSDLKPLADSGDINLVAAPGFDDAQSHAALIRFCAAGPNRFAVLDAPAQLTGYAPPVAKHGHAAIYAPALRVRDAFTGKPVSCPPSGHVCGVYAQTDARRGVWKAPANVALRGVLGLDADLTAQHSVLNPLGINAILEIASNNRIMDARTLVPGSSDYRYVPIRRLISTLCTSIERGTQWAVFEPNAEALWAAIRRDVSAFLMEQFRAGALVGERPEQAYFARCDRTTMSQTDLDRGRLIVEIGVAPVKPAEFIVLQTEPQRGR